MERASAELSTKSQSSLLDYGHRPSLSERLYWWLRRLIVIIPLVLCLGLLFLERLESHGLETIDIRIRRLHLVMMSERDQLCFSFEDDYQPISFSTFGGSIPAGASHVPVFGIYYLDQAGAPQRDNYSTYMISMHYHPFIDWVRGSYSGRGLKKFEINRPFGPNDVYQFFGEGIIVPAWWVAAPMLLPMLIWLLLQFVTAARRRRADRSGVLT